MQVFRAETEKELIDKLAKAQSQATRLIREQAKQIETLQGLLIESISVPTPASSALKPSPLPARYWNVPAVR